VSTGSAQNQSDVFKFVSGVSYSARTSQETISKLASTTAKSVGELNQLLAETEAKGERFLSSIVEDGFSFSVDDAEEIVSNLLAAENSFSETLGSFSEKEDAAVCDPDLYGRNEDLVIDAYKRSISLLRSLLAVTQNIRWAVMERAEDYGELVGEAQNAEEFLASLG